MNKRYCFASVVSEIQQSDIFMTAKARIFETPKANLNGVRVTPAFLDEIVGNSEKYVGLPLYADVDALKNGNYNRLGHLYDARTGEFHSKQIGSFQRFEREDFDGGSYLVAYARIPKRDKKLSKAIAELFADQALKFSFEIACGECEQEEDGTTLIDASENNYLEGTAIVTFPACEDAVALEFVAQREADDTRKGDEEMAEVEKLVAEETEATETAEAEQTVETVETAEEQQVEQAEQEKTEETVEESAEEISACKKDKEQAEVYTHEHSLETHTTALYDDDSGKSVVQTVTVETDASQPIEGTLIEEADGTVKIAEGEDASGESGNEANGDNNGEGTTQTSEESEEDIPVVEDAKKKTAEQLIAELAEVVSSIKADLEELKASKTAVVASAVKTEVNPFMGSINCEKKYALLEEAKPATSYDLLEEA